jgi:hypothetical protein
LWGVVLGDEGPALPQRDMWPALLVMGLVNNAVPFTLFVLAQGQITGALASVLNAMTPIFTVLVAHVATADEKLTPARALGVALGFAGCWRCWPTAGWGDAAGAARLPGRGVQLCAGERLGPEVPRGGADAAGHGLRATDGKLGC